MGINTTAGDFIGLYGDFETPEFWLDFGVQSTGFIIPTFEELIQREIDLFREVYGSNLDIDPSSPEGQLIYNEAKDKYSIILMAQAVYNSFSLTNASGQALDRNLQYVGIMRKDDSFSQATVVFDTIDGVTPVTLSMGYQFTNQQGDIFQITNTITFVNAADPNASVSAIAVDPGPVDVSADNLNTITNPRGNLASVTNPTAGIEGTEEESDVEARQRGVGSSESRSKSTISGTLNQIKNLDNVQQAVVFENKSDSTVGILQAHSVRYVVRGGSDSEIGQVLYVNEVPGIAYIGDGVNTVTHTVTEDDGIETVVYFDRPDEDDIYVKVPITTREFDTEITNSILDYVNNSSFGFTIGEKIVGNKMYGACYDVLKENNSENTNKVGDIQVSFDGVDFFDELPIVEDHIGVFDSAKISFVTITL
ncbi:baseplate J/gp47 family protein [Candidatus Pacearchaeota archaeon]|nr:baseplate J/gp47 family protein [Candidatus Pacearchaeota archaeon]